MGAVNSLLLTYLLAYLLTCQMRPIQCGEKERADLFGRSVRGHFVLVSEERRKPRPLL